MSQMLNRTFLYGFIPVASGSPLGPEYYRCQECSHEFQADGRTGYDFGQHQLPQTWSCFKCNKEIAYERFDCPHCGYVFDCGQGRQ